MATEYTESHNQILKDALPQLPGVIRSVALRELRLAMREFFERSYAWTKIVKNIAVPVGDVAIQVDDGDSNTEVIAVLGVRYGNDTDGYRPLRPLVCEPTKLTSDTSPSSWYITSNPDEFKIHSYASQVTTDTLQASVALIPAFDTDGTADVLPRQISLKFYDAILNGFLARMYLHPAKPYSQPVLGTQLRQNFVRQMGYYAAQRKKGFNNTPNWSFPQNGWSTYGQNR